MRYIYILPCMGVIFACGREEDGGDAGPVRIDVQGPADPKSNAAASLKSLGEIDDNLKYLGEQQHTLAKDLSSIKPFASQRSSEIDVLGALNAEAVSKLRARREIAKEGEEEGEEEAASRIGDAQIARENQKSSRAHIAEEAAASYRKHRSENEQDSLRHEIDQETRHRWNLEDQEIDDDDDDQSLFGGFDSAEMDNDVDAAERDAEEVVTKTDAQLRDANDKDAKRLKRQNLEIELEEDDCPEGYVLRSSLTALQAKAHDQKHDNLPCPVALADEPCPCVMEYFEKATPAPLSTESVNGTSGVGSDGVDKKAESEVGVDSEGEDCEEFLRNVQEEFGEDADAITHEALKPHLARLKPSAKAGIRKVLRED